MSSLREGWSQEYTCEKCSFQMTIYYQNNKLRVKGKGKPEQKPNMRWTSSMSSDTKGLRCPNCGYPVKDDGM
jgi:DNA-directed RNA polymerase subunit RPC12/RpoP